MNHKKTHLTATQVCWHDFAKVVFINGVSYLNFGTSSVCALLLSTSSLLLLYTCVRISNRLSRTISSLSNRWPRSSCNTLRISVWRVEAALSSGSSAPHRYRSLLRSSLPKASVIWLIAWSWSGRAMVRRRKSGACGFLYVDDKVRMNNFQRNKYRIVHTTHPSASKSHCTNDKMERGIPATPSKGMTHDWNVSQGSSSAT